MVTGVTDMITESPATHFGGRTCPWIPIGATTLLLFALNAMTVKAFGEAGSGCARQDCRDRRAGPRRFRHGCHGHGDEGTAAAVSNCGATAASSPQIPPASSAVSRSPSSRSLASKMVGATVAQTGNTLPTVQLRSLFASCSSTWRRSRIMMVTWDQVSPEVPAFRHDVLADRPGYGDESLTWWSSLGRLSANSGIYSTPRMLYGLARQEQAPGVLPGSPATTCSTRPVPSCVCLLSGIVIMGMGGSISHPGVHARNLRVGRCSWACGSSSSPTIVPPQAPAAACGLKFKAPGG